MINGSALRDAIISGANNLTNNKKRVDELNVFPVPDGDTGTNMSMTINGAVRELANTNDESAGNIAEITAAALLRNARGNSGVILSLLFRGIAKALKGHNEIGGRDFAAALNSGVDSAYKAVMKPTEGTILTVARLAGEKASETAVETDDINEVFDNLIYAAKNALDSTPEILPVLKKAGVVDAGGQGFLYILEGMQSVLKNGVMIESQDMDAPQVSRSAAAESEAEITFTYCTEFIVKRNPEAKKEPKLLRAYLETIGDSAVFVEDEHIIKIHVHTDHPGKVIEKALEYGQLVNLKIDNMRDQHEGARHEADKSEKSNDARPAEADAEDMQPVPPANKYGFVCVAAVDGLKQLFLDLGADKVVTGGQTMNPSTDDILKAIEATPAQTVFVLPNNKNIIMAAEQAVSLATRDVIVLNTKTIPMGLSAMLAFDEGEDVDINAMAMDKAAQNIGTGQVTYAARDSEYDGHSIKKGEILAMEGSKLIFTGTDMAKAVLRLTKTIFKKHHSSITLIYGSDTTEEQAEEISAMLSQKFGDSADVTVVNGGQPVYYYIIWTE